MRALSVFAYTCLEEVGIWKKLEEPCTRKDHRHEQGHLFQTQAQPLSAILDYESLCS